MKDNDIDMNLLKSFEQRQEELRSSKSEPTAQEERLNTVGATPGKSSTTSPAQPSAPQPEQQEQQEPEKPKGVLEKDITVKDIKIPGLDL